MPDAGRSDEKPSAQDATGTDGRGLGHAGGDTEKAAGAELEQDRISQAPGASAWPQAI
jgi:hypothetical protein